VTGTSSDVVRRETRPIQYLHRTDVRVSDIKHVNVVAEAGSIWRRVISSKDRKSTTLSCGRLEEQRNDMGFWLMSLADTIGGSACVEVPHSCDTPTISTGVPRENPFKHQLSLTVRVHRVLRMIFNDGYDFGISVNGRRGRE